MNKIERPKKQPEQIDYDTARKLFDDGNPDGLKYDDLPTRKRNRLAQDEMYHREYRELCRAITRT